MSIKIIDNFLDQNDFDNIKNLLMGTSFDWRFQSSILRSDYKYKTSCDENNNYQFIHCFYNFLQPTSDYYNCLFPFFHQNKLNPKALVRVKANLNPRTDKNVIHGYHCDLDFLCKTAVYYVNSNNGFTIFSNGKKVESVENRIVIFNSNLMHSGATCTDEKTRVVINFNYFP